MADQPGDSWYEAHRPLLDLYLASVPTFCETGRDDQLRRLVARELMWGELHGQFEDDTGPGNTASAIAALLQRRAPALWAQWCHTHVSRHSHLWGLPDLFYADGAAAGLWTVQPYQTPAEPAGQMVTLLVGQLAEAGHAALCGAVEAVLPPLRSKDTCVLNLLCRTVLDQARAYFEEDGAVPAKGHFIISVAVAGQRIRSAWRQQYLYPSDVDPFTSLLRCIDAEPSLLRPASLSERSTVPNAIDLAADQLLARAAAATSALLNGRAAPFVPQARALPAAAPPAPPTASPAIPPLPSSFAYPDAVGTTSSAAAAADGNEAYSADDLYDDNSDLLSLIGARADEPPWAAAPIPDLSRVEAEEAERRWSADAAQAAVEAAGGLVVRLADLQAAVAVVFPPEAAREAWVCNEVAGSIISVAYRRSPTPVLSDFQTTTGDAGLWTTSAWRQQGLYDNTQGPPYSALRPILEGDACFTLTRDNPRSFWRILLNVETLLNAWRGRASPPDVPVPHHTVPHMPAPAAAGAAAPPSVDLPPTSPAHVRRSGSVSRWHADAEPLSQAEAATASDAVAAAMGSLFGPRRLGTGSSGGGAAVPPAVPPAPTPSRPAALDPSARAVSYAVPPASPPGISPVSPSSSSSSQPSRDLSSRAAAFLGKVHGLTAQAPLFVPLGGSNPAGAVAAVAAAGDAQPIAWQTHPVPPPASATLPELPHPSASYADAAPALAPAHASGMAKPPPPGFRAASYPVSPRFEVAAAAGGGSAAGASTSWAAPADVAAALSAVDSLSVPGAPASGRSSSASVRPPPPGFGGAATVAAGAAAPAAPVLPVPVPSTFATAFPPLVDVVPPPHAGPSTSNPPGAALGPQQAAAHSVSLASAAATPTAAAIAAAATAAAAAAAAVVPVRAPPTHVPSATRPLVAVVNALGPHFSLMLSHLASCSQLSVHAALCPREEAAAAGAGPLPPSASGSSGRASRRSASAAAAAAVATAGRDVAAAGLCGLGPDVALDALELCAIHIFAHEALVQGILWPSILYVVDVAAPARGTLPGDLVSALKPVFEGPNAPKTMTHGAGSGLQLLRERYGVESTSVVDTQTLNALGKLAARLRQERPPQRPQHADGMESAGLPGLLSAYGLPLPATVAGTQAEEALDPGCWRRRPLTPELAQYAALQGQYQAALARNVLDDLHSAGVAGWLAQAQQALHGWPPAAAAQQRLVSGC